MEMLIVGLVVGLIVTTYLVYRLAVTLQVRQ